MGQEIQNVAQMEGDKTENLKTLDKDEEPHHTGRTPGLRCLCLRHLDREEMNFNCNVGAIFLHHAAAFGGCAFSPKSNKNGRSSQEMSV